MLAGATSSEIGHQSDGRNEIVGGATSYRLAHLLSEEEFLVGEHGHRLTVGGVTSDAGHQHDAP